MLTLMSDTGSEIPVVDTDQVSALSSSKHAQTVVLTMDESETYMAMWDGTHLRLMLPFNADIENSLIVYKILGHIEVDLPFPLDPVTFERQAQFLIHAYKDGLTESEEGSEDD